MSKQLTTRENLPPKRGIDRPTYDWAKIAAELRADPGEWHKVFDYDRSSLATAIRIRGIKDLLPEDGFEVTTRNNTRDTDDEPRMCTMYLRWMPMEGQ